MFSVSPYFWLPFVHHLLSSQLLFQFHIIIFLFAPFPLPNIRLLSPSHFSAKFTQPYSTFIKSRYHWGCPKAGEVWIYRNLPKVYNQWWNALTFAIGLEMWTYTPLLHMHAQRLKTGRNDIPVGRRSLLPPVLPVCASHIDLARFHRCLQCFMYIIALF